MSSWTPLGCNYCVKKELLEHQRQHPISANLLPINSVNKIKYIKLNSKLTLHLNWKIDLVSKSRWYFSRCPMILCARDDCKQRHKFVRRCFFVIRLHLIFNINSALTDRQDTKQDRAERLLKPVWTYRRYIFILSSECMSYSPYHVSLTAWA